MIQETTAIDWHLLKNVLHELEHTPEWGHMDSGTEIATNTYVWAGWRSGKTERNLLKAFHESGAIIHFQYAQWEDGIAMLRNANTDYSCLNLLTLRKLLTLLILSDRMIDGLLCKMMQNGTITRILHAIIHSETTPTNHDRTDR